MEPESTGSDGGSFVKNVLPLLGRVGAIAGGIVSLLAVLEKVGGTIITTIEAFLLVIAIVSSGYVVWSRTTQVEDDKKVRVPAYSKMQRNIAGVILVMASLLTLAFTARVGYDVFQAKQVEIIGNFVPEAPKTATAQAERATVDARVRLWPTVVSDDFSKDAGIWSRVTTTDDFGTISRSISAGKYHIEIQAIKPTGALWIPLPVGAAKPDFYLTVEGQKTSGPSDAAYGLTFRYSDMQNKYTFQISDDQRFLVFLWLKGQSTLLLGRPGVAAIRPGGMNRLTVSGEGKRMIFFINNEYVGALEDDRVNGSRMGLLVEVYEDVGALFDFDNFEWRAPQ